MCVVGSVSAVGRRTLCGCSVFLVVGLFACPCLWTKKKCAQSSASPHSCSSLPYQPVEEDMPPPPNYFESHYDFGLDTGILGAGQPCHVPSPEPPARVLAENGHRGCV